MYTSVEGVCRDKGTDSDTSTSVSKSSGLEPMHVGSITIDLNLPISVKEKGECQHFSIRGYVAEMRNKDMKICSPFASSSKSDEQLPPLDVPKFKWWQCDKCLQEIGADHESAGDEIGDASVHTGSTTSVAYILSEMTYMSDSRKGDKSKEIMNDFADTSENDVISLWKCNKTICNVVGNKTVNAVNSLGDGTGSQGVIIKEIDSPSTEVIVSKKCSTQEIETNDPVANLLNISTNTKPIPSNNGQRTTSNQIEVLGSKEKVINMSNMKSHGLPSLELRKGTGTSKGSDANLVENSLCNWREDIENNVPRRRKTPKVRLMADLLSGKDNLERSCANTMPMVPYDPNTVVAPDDNVSLLENIGRGIKISQKKRNTTQEDGCRSGMNLDGKMDTKLKAINQNKKTERSSMDIEVNDSRPGENESDKEQYLQSGSISVKVKHRNGKESGISIKKHKQDQIVDGYFVQMPLEEKSSGLGSNKHDANILFQSSHISRSTGNVEHHLRNNNELLHGKERDSGLNWNSNKLLKIKHASSHMNVSLDKTLQKESLSNGKDVVQMPIGMGMVITSQPEKELSFTKKLDHSLSIFKDAHKHVENGTIQSKSITNYPLTLQKDNKSCDPLRSNVFEPGQYLEKGVNSLVRPSNLSEIDQYLKKGVNLLVRQPNVTEIGQYLSKGMDPHVNVAEIVQYSRKKVNPLVNMAEITQYSRKRVNPLVNVAETTQYSRKVLNPLVNVAEITQYSRKELNPLVRQPDVAETSQYSRNGMEPLVRQPNLFETGQYLQKGVHSQLRQSNLSESGQPTRKSMIDLNQESDLNQWQGIESSLNLFHRGNLQIQNPMETPRPSSNINLNEVQGHSNVTKPQKNHSPKNVMGKVPSDYVRPMGMVDMFIRNQHERIHPQTQSNWRIGTTENGVLTWLNPRSTSLHPIYANDVGALRGNTPHLSNVKVNNDEIIEGGKQQFKLFNTTIQSQQKPSNRVQVSAPVPTGMGLQHGEGSNLVWFPNEQRILFGHDNPHNYVNQENDKLILGQSPGSLQKGRTISDIKSSTMELKSWNECSLTSKIAIEKEHNSKGIGSSNSYSSEDMPETQSLKLQERPFTPYNNHPPIHMDGNKSIFNGSFFPHHQLMKESSSVPMGGFTVVQSSQQLVPYFNDQVSLRQEKKRKLQHPVSSSSLLHTTSKEESRGFIGGASSSKVILPQDDNVSKSLYMQGPVAIFPISSILEKDPPCLFNQNPTDIAEVDDERYLRSAEDQRIRDRSSVWEKSGVVNVDGRKRQRRKERPGRMPVVL